MTSQKSPRHILFARLSSGVQAQFLARFAWEVTVMGRETYVVGGTDLADATQMRELNELQHRILGHLCALLRGDVSRRPDDAIVECMLSSDNQRTAEQAQLAFDRTVKFVSNYS